MRALEIGFKKPVGVADKNCSHLRSSGCIALSVSQSSAFFYKSKLNFYNFTISDKKMIKHFVSFGMRAWASEVPMK
jgi:hypothetical protein